MEGVKNQELKTEVLREARKALRMNQRQFAEKLGSDHTDISRLETGKKIPDWLTKALILHRLMDRAGFSFDDLLLSLPDPPEKSLTLPIASKKLRSRRN